MVVSIADQISISEYFDNFFSLELANTPFLLDEVHRIRYEVYCLDLKYEAAERFPDAREKDEYDSHSIHCLLKYKITDHYIGCVRVVLPVLQQPEKPFPFEKIYPSNLNINFSTTSRTQFCEVSRLAVISDFRRRKDEQQTAAGYGFSDNQLQIESQERRRFPALIPLCLYLASTSIVLQYELQAFTLMEPRLARHLKRCGLPSYQLGSPVEFHGERAPFLMNPHEVIENLSLDNLELFQLIHARLTCFGAGATPLLSQVTP